MVIYLPELSDTSLEFPPVSQALTEPDGLLAMGGDLSPQRLLKAYQSGIFPGLAQVTHCCGGARLNAPFLNRAY